MKKTILLIMAAVPALCSQAVVTQKVILKNGSVLNGYIQQQDKNDNIIFHSENALITIDGKDINVSDKVYSVKDLTPEWIEWGEKNNAFQGTGDNRTLTLSDVSFGTWFPVAKDSLLNADGPKDTFEINLKGRHGSISKVKMIEKGAIVKYQELTPNTYTFNWNDVETIKSDRRPRTMLSGIDRTYILNNGKELTGQYAGETYNTLSLYDKDGVVETFNITDVVKNINKGINPDQNIFEQSPLIDIVNTKSNGTYRGIIVERNYSKDNKYLMIREPAGSSQMIKFSDVAYYTNDENPQYAPVEDVIIEKGVILVNKVHVDTVGVKKMNTHLVLDSVNPAISIKRELPTTHVVVEFNNEDHLSTDNLILVRLEKNAPKKKQAPLYGFSTDIYDMRKFTPIKTSTSVNNTVRMEYVLPQGGVYALYDVSLRKAMPFVVKQ